VTRPEDIRIMEIGDTKIIGSRKGSAPGNSWSEDLFLLKIDETVFELFVGGYEAIAEASDFFDEELGEDVIPDKIDGISVQGVEDGYVVGGQILINEDVGDIRFTDVDADEVGSYLESIRWNDVDTITAIKAALNTSAI
jgi:hypothetical protein